MVTDRLNNQKRFARRNFLLLLERDLPNYYLEREWDPALKKQLRSLYPHNYRMYSLEHYLCMSKYEILTKRFIYTIAWQHLILALKRKAYSDEHGLGLEAFRHEVTTTTAIGPDRYMIQLTIEPKIVTGRLLLRCKYVIWKVATPPCQITAMELQPLYIHICRHQSTNPRSSTFDYAGFGHCLNAHDDDNDDPDVEIVLDPHNALKTFRGHCNLCMTDWYVAL